MSSLRVRTSPLSATSEVRTSTKGCAMIAKFYASSWNEATAKLKNRAAQQGNDAVNMMK
jgi:hypothetical protein